MVKRETQRNKKNLPAASSRPRNGQSLEHETFDGGQLYGGRHTDLRLRRRSPIMTNPLVDSGIFCLVKRNPSPDYLLLFLRGHDRGRGEKSGDSSTSAPSSSASRLLFSPPLLRSRSSHSDASFCASSSALRPGTSLSTVGLGRVYYELLPIRLRELESHWHFASTQKTVAPFSYCSSSARVWEVDH